MEKEPQLLSSESNGIIPSDKPDLKRRLFWEFVYDEIQWKESYALVIERVIEWGVEEEWQEVIRFYGYDKVLRTLKFECNYLMDHTIEKVCNYFKVKPEELRCYVRKQS